MHRDPLVHIENLTKKANDYMGARSQSAFGRYPLLFSLLTIFGLVSILYGFESAIARVPFLAERPLLVFFIGFLTLIFTGSLYKSLDKQRL